VKVLIINPSKWGRGITPIWIASHSSVLKSNHHEVELFDATFFKNWAVDENTYNTSNQQYQPSDYLRNVKFTDEPVLSALQKSINKFRPDIVFFAAISSHIHGEGEYAAIQFAYELISGVDFRGKIIAGGLQTTAAPEQTAERFARIDLFIRGESEFVLPLIVSAIEKNKSFKNIQGLVYRDGEKVIVNLPQPIIANLDEIGPYDYSVFQDQIFFRPYNGNVVRAVDYEISRGCPFTCSYCVETVIQNYYGFSEKTPRGLLKTPKAYLRHKTAKRVFEEIKSLHKNFGISLFRCQDTNFLTINRETLFGLAELFENEKMPIKLYIETRPEGINEGTIPLLKRLQVDGIGMGIELATQDFREGNLNRFADQPSIVKAFQLLQKGNIKRTAYNIIGLPDQDEESILDTIKFNRLLNPDNVTVAFYSPYIGTEQQKKGASLSYFSDYEYNVDNQLRTTTRHDVLNQDLLNFYKKNFIKLVKDKAIALNPQTESLA